MDAVKGKLQFNVLLKNWRKSIPVVSVIAIPRQIKFLNI
jgi:hypothetical protein